ncbi:hypothetical protein [Alterisphingorhabdus coralli]|uniref:DUF4105 domain-containing protein n=1 Tax=Alterisphingorhabdus coralli TaxID=3071408 RepID=A0AA97I2W2_9SPHN|nr:hypothetical protein [Parasphingorhabdus sp. SCSIO 66989]WOE76130.1 hypothetical protein RB602_05290 [Parasphingorhabdus sp. SCSIO 66989]
MLSIRAFCVILIAPLLFWASAAQAAVTITFYSHDFGSSFPHAFVVLKGTLDSTGDKVDINYGFTAVNVSPNILFGSVKGKIETSKPKYVANSDAHFSMVLSDRQYYAVIAKMVEWRDWPQKSYNLNKHNCVHFVAEVAQTLGLKTNPKTNYWKKPKSFLREVRRLNPGVRVAANAPD